MSLSTKYHFLYVHKQQDFRKFPDMTYREYSTGFDTLTSLVFLFIKTFPRSEHVKLEVFLQHLCHFTEAGEITVLVHHVFLKII